MKTSTDSKIILKKGEVALVLSETGVMAYMPEGTDTEVGTASVLLATLCNLTHPSTPEMRELIEKAVDLTLTDMLEKSKS